MTDPELAYTAKAAASLGDQIAMVDDRPEGMIDYEARCIIRDLIRIDGFEKAREKIAFFLMDEADRRRN